MIIADNFNEIYVKLISRVKQFGIESSPRGMPIKELLGVQFKLTNPFDSLCTFKKRKLGYKFAIIEKLEYLSGDSDPDRLCHYNKNMSHFINENTGEFDGAYAPRIKRQLDYIVDLFKRDLDTRQAVININNEGDNRESKDVPCTISLQFLLRNGKLTLIVYMRSNDLLWGVPYDVNGFCLIQQAMASWLGVKLGDYIHIAGSLHYYLEREKQLLKLLTYHEGNKEKNPRFNLTREQTDKEFIIFWSIEKDLRNGIKIDKNDKRLSRLSLFFQESIARLM